jgi:phage shock protein A
LRTQLVNATRVHAIESATDSIERHVAVIETLATSVDPLRASVDRLTDTMQELAAMMAPLGAAEHEMQRAGRLFGRHRHADRPADEGSIEP